MNNEKSAIYCLVCLILGLLVGLCIGQCLVDMDRDKAIQADVAEFQVNKRTGVTSFVYKNCVDSQPIKSKLIPIPTEVE